MTDKCDLNAYWDREPKTLSKITIRSHLSIKDNHHRYRSKLTIEPQRTFSPLDFKRYCIKTLSRLHGGKGFGPFNHGSQDQDNLFEEDFAENEDYLEEEFDDQDSYLSSNSDLAGNSNSGVLKRKRIYGLNKKSSKANSISKPNLAIRVAKAAYYNNKDSLSSLQSKIFTDGGIRGIFNYFYCFGLKRWVYLKIKINIQSCIIASS